MNYKKKKLQKEVYISYKFILVQQIWSRFLPFCKVKFTHWTILMALHLVFDSHTTKFLAPIAVFKALPNFTVSWAIYVNLINENIGVSTRFTYVTY